VGEAQTVRIGLAALDAVLSVVLAPACATCEQSLDQPTRGPVCPRCWRSILPLTPPLCDGCGDPLPTWRTISLPLARCPRCRRTSRFVDRARSVGSYEGTLRSIVHALKYEGRRSLAGPLAALMRQHGSEVLGDAAFAIPVPLHPSRRRERGFNQAADLAGLRVVPALRRVRATTTQTGLPAAQRHRNVRDAFSATSATREVRGQVVVLVDDVCTTGATLEACARELKHAGVAEVRALTAARVVNLPFSNR